MRRITPLMMLVLVNACSNTVGSVSEPARGEVQRPNVIVIVADDLGYGDVGSYGSTVIRTPHIDRLAQSGVRFTSGYVSHPVCAPSRAALMTGRMQTRFGFEFNPVDDDDGKSMPLSETTVAQLMRKAGYRTALIGKWHLGSAQKYYPTDRGFDFYFGIAGGGSNFILEPRAGDLFHTIQTATTLNRPILGSAESLAQYRMRAPVTRNEALVDEREYLTDAFTREAVAFIEANQNRSFFLTVTYTAPHTPLQATARYVQRYTHLKDPGQRAYAAMVSALDDGVGAILDTLDRTGLRRDTLVVFLSDNGCALYLGGACSNGVLAGGKGSHLEGGIRVPFILSYPGKLGSAGRVDDRMVSSLDIAPTALALAGAAGTVPRPLDGTDLLALLERPPVPRTLYWRAGTNVAIREGDWKLWRANLAPEGAKASMLFTRPPRPEIVPAEIGPRGQHVMLYNLRTDPGETHNLAAQHPEIVERLTRTADAFDAGMVLPHWNSQQLGFISHDDQVLQTYN